MLFGSLFFGFLALPIVIDSQLVDVADEYEFNTGRRAEGVVFSIRAFAIKATSGIGGLIGGFGLEIINDFLKALDRSPDDPVYVQARS